ncbi:DegT/DnrJ/EryC1/StrS family aminotransferase [Lacicoccus alkaliphilus]|uniref:dTDP-4-amino-4,6-dideoxygalactose transaminase n=1 Tax=Lacicoccus alkaliphilus DSM 16010 TaxID=1123231 RepID=A0A1M7FWX5_9BACL|nr:DegT/DnrJ/EryC1/StrS family aminotransferase [Salinicoccus alkaliphilus]SHM08207.1 dTDP-4-amino-4,6-dideoxygalactose transaminase [Salinicoccus alkaliphilus DSM 16010]
METSLRNIPFSPPDITEKEIQKVLEVLESGWITTGPKTKELENLIGDYVGAGNAVCLNSATASMEMTLRLLGVGPGDEVITTPYTYTATAAVIHHVGASIVLVDTAKDSYEMDYKQLEEKISEKTKVIMPVDIAGKICDYNKIFEIVEAKKNYFKPANDIQESFNRVIILADAAHAFGAEQNGQKAGSIADFTCFSFHAVKNLTTAEGGAVVWKDIVGIDSEDLYKQFMMLSLHGQSKDALEKTKFGSWEYDIAFPGYKCNMTDIMASIGLAQLERYDGLLKRRKEIIEFYNQALATTDVEFLEHYNDNSYSSGHLYLTRLPGLDEKSRNNIIDRMSEKGISCNVHYKPLPLLTAYKNLGFNIKNYPNSYKQYQNEITLPLHTMLEDEDLKYIVNTFKSVLIEYKRGLL